MSTLREDLIRLAYRKPELRKDLIPLLAESKTASTYYGDMLLTSKDDFHQFMYRMDQAGDDELLNRLARIYDAIANLVGDRETRALNKFNDLISRNPDLPVEQIAKIFTDIERNLGI